MKLISYQLSGSRQKELSYFVGNNSEKKLFAMSRMIVLYADTFSGDKLFMIKILQIDVYKT